MTKTVIELQNVSKQFHSGEQTAYAPMTSILSSMKVTSPFLLAIQEQKKHTFTLNDDAGNP